MGVQTPTKKRRRERARRELAAENVGVYVGFPIFLLDNTSMVLSTIEDGAKGRQERGGAVWGSKLGCKTFETCGRECAKPEFKLKGA